MSIKTRYVTLFFGALAGLIIFAAALSTCKSPFGFGETIDWEPPVLTMDPGTNPRYVRRTATLSGSVTDNVAVDRVIVRDAATLEELFTATITGDRWNIEMTFTDEDDGKKLAVEVVAFDQAGNSGARSMAAISLIIDVSDPVVDDIWITRTSMKISYLEPWIDLNNLENGPPSVRDLLGNINDNKNRYQNGWFYIDARLSEEITRIDRVKLQLFDSRYPDTPLLPEDEDVDTEALFQGRKRDAGSTVTAPRWLIKEEELIAYGEEKWPGYRNDYYNNGKRFYYQVVVMSHDLGLNEGRWRYEEQSFFVMWERGDVPKGILDPMVSGTSQEVMITKGDTLPVEFFDDDALTWAYAGLLTLDQWKGYKEGTSYDDPNNRVKIDTAGNQMPNVSDAEKLNWLKKRLVDDGLGAEGSTHQIFNWKNDRSYTEEADTEKIITEILGGASPDEKIEFIQTGKKDDDYGEFVLFTLVKDKKLPPHEPYGGAPETITDRWVARMWSVMIVDDNQPMIVFDTMDGFAPAKTGQVFTPGNVSSGGVARNGSPEENTFPRLVDGRFFTIHGYTLRQTNENVEGNSVTSLKMAWIPFGAGASEQAALVPEVLKALKDGSALPPGVQSWTLTLTNRDGTLPSASPSPNPANEFTYEHFGSSAYRKQFFSKTFDILGQDTNVDSVYRHFHDANGKFENETKLFVFLAVDNMGHGVEKQLPILGKHTPPKLTVFDISDRTVPTGVNLQPPDINTFIANEGGGILNSAARAAYQAELKRVNAEQETFDGIETIFRAGTGGMDEATTLQIYPRGKTLKYWAHAEEDGGIQIAEIIMEDITTNPRVALGNFQKPNLSYIETLPEVTQRVFLFTVTDILGNDVAIQRTVTISNTAMLSSITTPRPTATYGISNYTTNKYSGIDGSGSPVLNSAYSEAADDRIHIYAGFSGMISWTGTNPPLLNIVYENPKNQKVLRQLPTITPRDAKTLALEFSFSVPEYSDGFIETMYDSIKTTDNPTGYFDLGSIRIVNSSNANTPAIGDINRPITMPEGTRIVDVSRAGESVPAFVPGYTSGTTRAETWRTDTNSLQDKKTITLDGIRPVLVPASGTAYLEVTSEKAAVGTNSNLYLKRNEAITFKLKADRRVQPSGAGIPRIQFFVLGTNGSTVSGPYFADYSRSSTDGSEMLFTFTLTEGVANGTVIQSSTNNNAQSIQLNTANGGVESIVGNVLVINSANRNTSNIPTPLFQGARNVYFDQEPPVAPITRLRAGTGTTVRETFTGSAADLILNEARNVFFEDSGATNEFWGVTKQYSLNGGGTWLSIPGSAPDNPGVTETSGVPLGKGTHVIRTRYIDTAGNEGLQSSRTVTINTDFPKLVSVSTTNNNGYYTSGTLTFNLEFEESVRIDGTTTITVRDRSADTGAFRTVTLTAATRTTMSSTVTFTWTLPAVGTNTATVKEMPNGLYISALNFGGLVDAYGNRGGSNGTGATGSPGTLSIPASSSDSTIYTVSNLNGSGIIVDTKRPEVNTRTPATMQGRAAGNVTSSVSTNNRQIQIEFNEAVIKGNGTITIRPHGNYAIPAVFENDAYYVTVNTGTWQEARATASAANAIRVAGFADIFNNVDNADRNVLLNGTNGTPVTGISMSTPPLSGNTGLSIGPYKKMTHGLTTGDGYTGNYSNNSSSLPNGAAPAPTGGYMVPDISPKWVLDYQYEIHSTSGVVSNIRAVLNRAKFRWQEIDVTSSRVSVSGNMVTIDLSEPLLPGLQWGVFYTAGSFTDRAGNSLAAGAGYTNDTTMAATSDYWFWSGGIQIPVIRVDRKSYDARQNVPAAGTGSGVVAQTYNDANAHSGSMSTFTSVAYRIETETPTARIFSVTRRGNGNAAEFINGAWTGTASASGSDLTQNISWVGPKSSNGTTGQWVRPNLVYRNAIGGNYNVGNPAINTRTISGQTGMGTATDGNYMGFRSFNKDLLATELDSATLVQVSTTPSYSTQMTGFNALEASKNYVIANAQIHHASATFPNSNPTHTSQKGYEGIFRSVVMINQGSGGSATDGRIYLMGTDQKGALPSAQGFPVRDGIESRDTRYLKVFYRNSGSQYYWVSTEIVNQWYVQTFGNGTNAGNSRNLRIGDANDWLSAGYGDLTYAFGIRTWEQNGQGI
jgi:hypothetical protein